MVDARVFGDFWCRSSEVINILVFIMLKLVDVGLSTKNEGDFIKFCGFKE